MGKKQQPEEKPKRKQSASSEEDDLDSDEAADLYDKPVKEKSSSGQVFWSLTKNKRVSISSFKGKAMVNIRQFWEKDGEWLPTKKGISLTKDVWKTFKKLVKDIDTALEKAEK